MFDVKSSFSSTFLFSKYCRNTFTATLVALYGGFKGTYISPTFWGACDLLATYLRLTCDLAATYLLLTCDLLATYLLLTCDLLATYLRLTCYLLATYLRLSCDLLATYLLLTCDLLTGPPPDAILRLEKPFL